MLHIAEERGEGPTVLLPHGIASSSVTFHHVIPLLERTRRCIAIDLHGFGEPPAPEWADYTLADHVAAIERTVASLMALIGFPQSCSVKFPGSRG